MRIGKIKNTEDDNLVQWEDRLGKVLSELECPTWMLGQTYKSKLLTERSKLRRKISRLDNR